MSNTIAPQYLETSIPYAEYRTMIDGLLEKNQTTGENHSEDMLGYTRLNVSRMKRLDKTTRLTEETLALLQQIDRPLIWLVITEGWCGDAAQIIPVFQKMVDQQPLIDLRLILRDENLELMDAFLTDGGRSIPKLICIDAESKEILGDWGPRPIEAQAQVMAVKAELAQIEDPEARKKRYQESQNELHLWYARDKTKSIQREFVAKFQELLIAT